MNDKRLMVRLHQIAKSFAPDYPDIENQDEYGCLWAIEQALIGVNAANKDLQQQLEQKDKLLTGCKFSLDTVKKKNKLLKTRNEKLERLGVLATKHCSSNHRDFEEIKAIYIELNELDDQLIKEKK